MESSRTSLASWTSSRTDFEVLGLGLEGQVLGLEASSPRKFSCPQLEDSTSFWIVKILWSAWKIFWKTLFCGDRLKNFCEDLFFFVGDRLKNFCDFLWLLWKFLWLCVWSISPTKNFSEKSQKFLWLFWKIFCWRSPEKFLKTFFSWRALALVSLVLCLGLEHSCPWPRECLSSERLSLALASDFFCVLGLGLEPCVLDSTSDFKLDAYNF